MAKKGSTLPIIKHDGANGLVQNHDRSVNSIGEVRIFLDVTHISGGAFTTKLYASMDGTESLSLVHEELHTDKIVTPFWFTYPIQTLRIEVTGEEDTVLDYRVYVGGTDD